MENMSKQYRKEKGMNNSSHYESKGNINPREEALLLGLIKNNGASTNSASGKTHQGVKKANLDDLIVRSKQSEHKAAKCSSSITLEELANKQGK